MWTTLGIAEDNDKKFRPACLEFLKRQIASQRPRLIVTLGPHHLRLLVEAFTHPKFWKKNRDLALHNDVDPTPYDLGAEFKSPCGSLNRAVVVPIAHTALGSAANSRTPRDFSPRRRGESQLLMFGWVEALKLPVE